MTNIISGKEAKLAWAKGEDVQISHTHAVLEAHKHAGLKKEWHDLYGTLMLSAFDSDIYEFRLKPRTITLNGIEVPAPFEPKEFEDCYMLTDLYEHGYTMTSWKYYKQVPAWRTEEEIKQVVAALRSIFK